MGFAPLLLRAAPFHGLPLLPGFTPALPKEDAALPFSDVHLTPRYPARSPLEDVLRLVAPGSDEYVTEKYAFEIEAILREWSRSILTSPRDLFGLSKFLDPLIEASPLTASGETALRTGGGVDAARKRFAPDAVSGQAEFLRSVQAWLSPFHHVETAEFEMVQIEEIVSGRIAGSPPAVRAEIRYDLVATRGDERREERVGSWQTEWSRDSSGTWKARLWKAREETAATAHSPVFLDVTSQCLGGTESYTRQMLRGVDYWRTVLDGACGIDVYGNNGIAVGDFDHDGFDDLYVSQPAGLPNRLYRNRGDGTFEDVTEKAGVGVLDSTACALFADFRNKGLQDLLVVCGSGPLLFLNQGDGTFSLKRDAFRFKKQPQGTFTHAAVADYDHDGRLDIYFCLYNYYLGLDQYHYPVPYFDARNGPPNFLLHNEGDGAFEDRTDAAGLNAENDRYSFACAWGDFDANGWPDLYVANDFGRSNLYRNNGDGTFAAVSEAAHVQDAGAGMSAAWSDCDNDGKQDIYAANMWSSAGQRVAAQTIFHQQAPEAIRSLYRRHARGNSLYRNQGDGTFQNIGAEAGVEMGRWSWCSDFWDFDHDGWPDLYVANGYISGPEREDLASFFWRQVVGRSPEDATPSLAYEHGWNALNELIRSDRSWSAYERNVMFANNRDGTFSEVSGVVGLDFPEDSRSFALADLDHDGRLEVILKNRNAPQLRILRNAMKDIGHSISFRLRGQKSNRDAIGASITVEVGSLRQMKSLEAGSGFLAQHTKELFFGVGKEEGTIRATIQWPGGLSQHFDRLPVNHRIEIEEGSSTFAAVPFSAPPAAWSEPGTQPPKESLPNVAETWLIEPLKAPDFSLPDLTGSTHTPASFRGRFTLLSFWTSTAPASREGLTRLELHSADLAAAQLAVVAINVDDAQHLPASQAFVQQERFSFPVLFATEETAGIYNIIYRYLFDRRRDLPIPTSFLLDKDGMIVKVYQGPLDPQKLADDVRSAPSTAADRMRKALPLGGVLCQDTFQRNDFTYGVAMFQHGYLEQAEASFRQVIAAKPDDAEAYYNLGTLYLRRNDFQQSRQYLEQTLKLRPNYPEAWNNLGMMAAQQNNPDEAIKDFQQSLLLRPGYAIALLNLGNVYRRQGSYEQASDYLNRALALQPDDPEANYSLGMLYAQQNQLAQAADALQRAITLRPDYPEALNNLGVLYVHERDYAKAEEQFRACIRLVPTYDQSWFNLARLFALQGDKQKARQVMLDLLQAEPDNANAKKALQMLQ
ncbi:FG-GAP-like repeat-containing protein [Paracidobacterium acidisoli]|nr:tetratricopeptide repeat protein [Paracidobacterium acidisoli]